ncbi:MAG: NAD-dependent epimerase/dehydratase family protein [Sulfuricurvum sp.]|uniref:NAD-dependent epimerase/dehydratase family protein n=1 Tax=Sulfuricurvum sp. TaxID=2025608 RepID=UPI0026316A22|nr:NAD-dependent epimerase/dehydratase family protein [Sulfuricurvum sp.]MDD2828063.1 NAD-dependent epimerase/dehydratase family protein [Sulfuricurvum sp.]MDD4948060.1 NAD-dependent epimerase/dehydratase family protein [Sulfuricurvum sp.]
MKILVIGGNSTIAKAFVASSPPNIQCVILRRDSSLRDYFHLTSDTFKGFDTIINFTAAVHDSIKDPNLIHRINADLPLFLAHKAKEACIQHFIQMSTIAVYGKTALHIDLKTAEYPDTLYAKSKYEADSALQNIQNDTFHVTIIRPPIVYGYNTPGNMKQLQKIIRTLPILPLGYNKNQRSLIYIDNLVTALWATVRSKPKGVILLRDHTMPSIQEITELIILNMKIKRYILPLPEFLIRWLCKFQSLPFYKLFSSLIIDDSYAQEKLGDYAKIPIHLAFTKMIRGEK